MILTRFKKNTCLACLLRNRCPATPGKEDYHLRIISKQSVAAETRQDKEQHAKNTSKRAAIEGTNCVLKYSQGLGKLRVREHHKCRVTVGFKMIARNFKQLVRYVTGDVRRSIQDASRKGVNQAAVGTTA